MFDLKCDEEIRLEVLKTVHERWHAPNASGRVEELHDVLLYEVFAALFIVSDEDQSGDVDVDEFMGCLAKLNKKEIERSYAKILMDEFDVDGSGVRFLLLCFLWCCSSSSCASSCTNHGIFIVIFMIASDDQC